jgi:hypothetical protein
MKKIKSNETSIKGQNVLLKGKISGDEICQRISDLINYHLIKLGHDQSGWDTLYRDPFDGRLWELIYLQSEQQGGGPPALMNISQEKATAKYDTLNV